jgi:hypothetical protein
MEEEQSGRLEEEEGVELEDVEVEEGDVVEEKAEEISSLGSFRSNRVQNILDDDSGMESPGQRAAAAIAGAMDFVKSRTL